MFYRLLSKLLDYPGEDLYAALPELRAAVAHACTGEERRVLEGFLDHLAGMEPLEAQAIYVQTFDLTPQHTLNLTHHLFGDDKNRGPALIDLAEFYKAFGLELRPYAANDADVEASGVNELPDHLPLMLEFAAQLEAEEARIFLAQWSKVLGQLAANLEAADSPYAPLVRLIEARSQLVRAAA
ncbi:MAG: nitrate reductase molybdenum cofactor assembly chaperone [Thiobacillaceae bacterium]